MVIRTDIFRMVETYLRDKLTTYEEVALLIYKHSLRLRKKYYQKDELIELVHKRLKISYSTVLKKLDKLRKLNWIVPIMEINPFFPHSYRITGYLINRKLIEYELKRRGYI